MKRVFIAINATNPLESTLLPTLKKLKISSNRKEMEIKWTPSSNYHITLSFLGERTDEEVEKIKEAILETAESAASFDLHIGGMSAFPEVFEGRVIWLGVQNSRILNQTKAVLDEELSKKITYLGEAQKYVPHLTIARLRSPKNLRDLTSPFVRKEFGKIHVDKLVLYESIQAGPFPVYKPLFEVELSPSMATLAEAAGNL